MTQSPNDKQFTYAEAFKIYIGTIPADEMTRNAAMEFLRNEHRRMIEIEKEIAETQIKTIFSSSHDVENQS